MDRSDRAGCDRGSSGGAPHSGPALAGCIFLKVLAWGSSRCWLRATSGADLSSHIARGPISGPGTVAVRARHTGKAFAGASLDGKGAIRVRTHYRRFGLTHELSDEH